MDPAILAPEQQRPVVGAEGDVAGRGVVERAQRGQRAGVADRDLAADERHDAAPVACCEHPGASCPVKTTGPARMVRPAPSWAPLTASKRLTSVRPPASS